MNTIKKLPLLMLALLLAGCTASIQRQIVTPTDNYYYKGNQHYDMQEYEQAIPYFEKLLDRRPHSDLATSTKLNLGMSYYHLGQHKKAFDILSTIKIEDEQIRAFVENICKDCKTKFAEADKQEMLLAENAQRIKIQINNAYIDIIGNVVIEGKTSMPALVTVNENKTMTDDNLSFSFSTSWRKGKAIRITASDDQKNFGELSYYPDREPPDEPENLRARSTSSNSIQVEWDENTESDVIGYKLFYRLRGGSLNEIPDIISDTDYEVVGLQNIVSGGNRTFEFYLRAVDKMLNESNDSDILQVDLP